MADPIFVRVNECLMTLQVGVYDDSDRRHLTLEFENGFILADVTVDVVDDGSLFEDTFEETVTGIHSGDIFAINNIGYNIGLMECLEEQGVIESIDETLPAPVPLGDGNRMSDFPLARLL